MKSRKDYVNNLDLVTNYRLCGVDVAAVNKVIEYNGKIFKAIWNSSIFNQFNRI